MKSFFAFMTLSFFSILLTGCENETDKENLSTIQVGEQVFRVEIAQTSPQRQKGLMFRETLPEGQGMLFVFDTDNYHQFWMKNTLIPLDVIWLDENQVVLEKQSMTPCVNDICVPYTPQQMSRFVLEVNQGEFLGKEGDQLQIIND